MCVITLCLFECLGTRLMCVAVDYQHGCDSQSPPSLQVSSKQKPPAKGTVASFFSKQAKNGKSPSRGYMTSRYMHLEGVITNTTSVHARTS